jgi:cell division protease FtsH
VEEFGLAPPDLQLGVRRFAGERDQPALSEETRRALERGVRQVLEEQRERARTILEAHRSDLVALRDLLLQRKVLDAEALAQVQAQALESTTE